MAAIRANPSVSPCAAEHALAEAGNAPCAAAARKWVLTACVAGSSMAFMDGTIVNVALPELQKVFSADMSRVQWVL